MTWKPSFSFFMSHQFAGSISSFREANTLFRAGNHIPFRGHEPRQVPIERHSPSIADRRRTYLRDDATNDAGAHAESLRPGFHVQLHWRSWQQAVTRFEQRPGG